MSSIDDLTQGNPGLFPSGSCGPGTFAVLPRELLALILQQPSVPLQLHLEQHLRSAPDMPGSGVPTYSVVRCDHDSRHEPLPELPRQTPVLNFRHPPLIRPPSTRRRNGDFATLNDL